MSNYLQFKKVLIAILSVGCTFSLVQAQKRRIFNIPKNIPAPCWVEKIDWDHPNVLKIDSIIRDCTGKNTLEEDNGEDEKPSRERELKEEPYQIAYLRWKKNILPFLQRDGTVKIDSSYYRNRMLNTIDKQGSVKNTTQGIGARTAGLATTSGSASWSIMGPKQTYADNNNGALNEQANIYRLAIAPSNNSILYAGSETGVLFKSTDKGLNWTAINDALFPGSVLALSVLPTDANTVYAYSNGLIKTTDGGSTWTYLTNFPSGEVYRIVFNPLNGRVIVASWDGIYYSNDGGSTWSQASVSVAPEAIIFDIAINPVNPNILYAVSATSDENSPMIMYRSTDGGRNFTAVTLPDSTYTVGARFAVTPANSNYVYCLTLQNDFPKLLKSTDAGLTWNVSAIFNGVDLFGYDATNGMSNGQGYYDQAIMASPIDTNQVIVGTTSAFKSTDAGATFTSLGGYLGPFPLHPDMQSMVAMGSDAYISTDGGVNYSSDFFTDRGNFSVRHNGLTASENWGFGQGWGDDIVVSGRYHNGNTALYDNYGTGNALALGGGEDATGHIFPIPGKSGIAGFRDIGTLQLPSLLTGQITSASFANTLWPTDDYYGYFSSKLMIDPRYANTFYVGNGNGLWKSQNSGASYTELKDFGSSVWRFDIARADPNNMVVCTYGGIYKSPDGGTTWFQLSLPAGINYQFYNSDIAINPINSDEIWFCMAGGDPASKIFRSLDGGATWTNYTGTVLNGLATAYIIAQGGTNSGVYAVVNSTPAKVFYRDASMPDWTDFSNGLPQNFTAVEGGMIFYRDSKLRLSGTRGFWESPLFSSGAPVAQPMADKRYVGCSKDTVRFGDYSMLEYAGAYWQWSFPGASFVSNIADREPKVLYPSPGTYDVSLTVTDAKGRSSSRTVPKMVTFTADNCSPDTVAGKSLVLQGTDTPVAIGTANINGNTFSLSCWIKPKGEQLSFAQLLCHDPYPGSDYGFGLGFTFSGYTPNLNLCYTDNIVNYYNYSNLVADTTKWNFVVLTYSPTAVVIYLNGIAQTVHSGTMPTIDFSGSPFYINKDILSQGGHYNGEIDEVKIYNYTLSQNEVREKMHLIQQNGIAETGLLNYVQFNKLDANTGSVYELVKGTQAVLPSATSLNVSTAPVASGTSYRLGGVNTGGHYAFPGTGVDLYWPSGGTYPKGQLVVSRLNSGPDSLADKNIPVPANGYFIIDNYGSNKTFTPLQKITFSNLPIGSPSYIPHNFSLYKRPSFAFDSLSWGNSLGTASSFVYGAGNTSTLTFANNNINSFSQFLITNNNIVALPVTLVSFTAQVQGQAIVASWLSQNESLGGYVLERCTDAIDFKPIRKIVPKNTPGGNAYTYSDVGISAGIVYYYRLKMVDMDGSYRYSPIRTAMLKSPTVSLSAISPNPGKGWISVTVTSPAGGEKISFYLYDAVGRTVYRGFETLNQGKNSIMLNCTGLAAGMYFFKAFVGNDEVGNDKLMITK